LPQVVDIEFMDYSHIFVAIATILWTIGVSMPVSSHKFHGNKLIDIDLALAKAYGDKLMSIAISPSL